MTTADLAAVPGVRRVAPLGYATAEFTSPNRSRTAWPATGIGPELASTPPKLPRPRRLPDRPGRVGGGRRRTRTSRSSTTSSSRPRAARRRRPRSIGDRIVMSDPLTGRSQSFTVAAIAENDFLLSGAFVSQDALTEVFRERAVSSRFFVVRGRSRRRSPADPLRRSSPTAPTRRPCTASSRPRSRRTAGFFTLMQQFVGAGLLVGVAGIGVIMFRAVRERRREVGVLRSLGFPRSWVGNVFMFEAGFVADARRGARRASSRLIASYVLAVVGRRLRAGLRLGSPGRRSAADRGDRACAGGPRRAAPGPSGVADRARGLAAHRRLNTALAGVMTDRAAYRTDVTPSQPRPERRPTQGHRRARNRHRCSCDLSDLAKTA